MIIRYLLLALVVGCTTSDPYAADEITARKSIAACSVSQWCDETLPGVSSFLYSVWAADADDVFAVGAGGTILYRHGGTWMVMASGTTANLHAVWGASATDVWVAGSGGVVLRFNGTAWSDVSTGTSWDINAMWGSSSTDVWFVGGAEVMHWDGTTFAASPTGGTFLSISGTGPLDVWATGENTYLRHFTGSWSTIKSTGTSTTSVVLAIAPNDLWVSDSLIGKETMHSTDDGVSWTPYPAVAGGFNSMAARASSDIWAVGGRSVGEWNGSVWTSTQPFGSTVSLQAVTTSSSSTAGNLWVVGGNGLIRHRVL
jgi:hypothetical protein